MIELPSYESLALARAEHNAYLARLVAEETDKTDIGSVMRLVTLAFHKRTSEALELLAKLPEELWRETLSRDTLCDMLLDYSQRTFYGVPEHIARLADEKTMDILFHRCPAFVSIVPESLLTESVVQRYIDHNGLNEHLPDGVLTPSHYASAVRADFSKNIERVPVHKIRTEEVSAAILETRTDAFKDPVTLLNYFVWHDTENLGTNLKFFKEAQSTEPVDKIVEAAVYSGSEERLLPADRGSLAHTLMHTRYASYVSAVSRLPEHEELALGAFMSNDRLKADLSYNISQYGHLMPDFLLNTLKEYDECAIAL